MTNAAAEHLSGKCLDNGKFRLLVARRHVDPAAAMAVLTGELAAYKVQQFISEENSRRVAERFWESSKRRPRYGEGDGGVEAYLIGASHIDKTTEEYLDEVADEADSVADLYRGSVNPLASFRDQLITNGAISAARPAMHGGRMAGDSKAVCWNNHGAFLLMPHDDMAQLNDPRQRGFEIQDSQVVMAVNVYPAVERGCGQIQVWNVAPDDECRARLGVEWSGYPYRPELLAGYGSILIPVDVGDLCLINGSLVHAVLGGEHSASSGRRLLLTCFTSLTPKGEFIWWT